MRERNAPKGMSGGHGQIEARPRVRFGEQGEPAIGIHGCRMPHDTQHRNVGIAVAEREALVEIVPVGARVIANDAGLLGTGDDRVQEFAGRDDLLQLQPA